MIVKSGYIVILISLVFSIFSCQNIDKTEKPKNLISEKKMVDILTELSLLHAARNYNKIKLENLGVIPDNYIYEKFGIDSLQFEKSNDYYADKYVQYDRIYDSVQSRIQRMKVNLDSLRDIEVKIEDSISQAKKDSIRGKDTISDSLKTNRDSLIEQRMRKRKLKKNGLITPVGINSLDSI